MGIKTLGELLQGIAEVGKHASQPITGLALDSRRVQAGDLFFALPGLRVDGRRYIREAIAQGAAAVIYDSGVPQQFAVPTVALTNLRQHVGEIAARFYDHPSSKLTVVGVTGTNGKTSFCHLLAQALQQLKITCGVAGTLGNGIYGKLKRSRYTTADPIALQAFFAEMVGAGAEVVALEVSSHGLAQDRVAGTDFNIGVLTNLGRDHLDYHGDLQAYGNAKAKLFEHYKLNTAIINLDDPFGVELTSRIPAEVKQLGYSCHADRQVNAVQTVMRAQGISQNLQTITADVSFGDQQGQLQANLVGEFNLRNLLAVLTTLTCLQIPLEKSLALIPTLRCPQGRMQMFGGGRKPAVVVDYAHTPDALQQALETLKQHTQGRLICVFGCGGQRDRGKRQLMGSVAENYCEQIILTNDNPRREDPLSIAADILQGIVNKSKVIYEPKRRQAVQRALATATPQDVIIVAGKGHEDYQVIGHTIKPFSDINLVQELLAE